jgi:hypothetical protein
MARRGETMAPDELTAARVQELLAGPERARQAAEAQRVAEARAPAVAQLRAALTRRLAVLAPIADEAAAWFAARPTVTQAGYEEMLGAHARELVDRVVKLGRDLLDSAGPTAQAAGQRALEGLADPASAAAVEVGLAALLELEEREAIVVHRATTWRTLRQATVAQLRRAIDATAAQCRWLEGDRHV